MKITDNFKGDKIELIDANDDKYFSDTLCLNQGVTQVHRQ